MGVKHNNESTETINIALREHQAATADWDFASLNADLHLWAERIIFDFKFETGIPALMIEPLRGRDRHYGNPSPQKQNTGMNVARRKIKLKG